MKREELKARIEETQLWSWFETTTQIRIASVCIISKTQVNEIQFIDMPYSSKWCLDVMKDILDYAMTPISEREDIKYFYLKMKGLNNENSYLNKGHGADAMVKGYFFSNTREGRCVQSKFTLEEIAQMPESFQNLTRIEVR